MYYVYQLCDPRRGGLPFYIGKGSKDRCRSHLYETYQTTDNRRKWCKIAAIRKAGLEVIIEKVAENLEEVAAYELEEKLITEYGRIGFDENGILTNICPSSRPPSPRGRRLSIETKEKISKSQQGPLNHRFGYIMSEEEKRFRRDFNLKNGIKPPNRSGLSQRPETKEKISLSMKGKKKSEAHCKAIGNSKKGIKQGPRSEEAKANMSAWQQRIYYFTSPEGKVYTIKSAKLTEFCQNFGMSYGGMMAAVKAKRPYKGWSIKRL